VPDRAPSDPGETLADLPAPVLVSTQLAAERLAVKYRLWGNDRLCEAAMTIAKRCAHLLRCRERRERMHEVIAAAIDGPGGAA
jgi:hypothetical protein